MASLRDLKAPEFANSPVASRTRRGKTTKAGGARAPPMPTPTLGDQASTPEQPQPGIGALAAAASAHSDANQADIVYGARRGAPLDYATQDQSIRSVSSEPGEQSRFDRTQDVSHAPLGAEHASIPYFNQFSEHVPEAAPASSSAVLDSQESPSGLQQQLALGRNLGGKARALNKALPRLLDAAKEVGDLLSERRPSADFIEELEAAREQLAALSRLYRKGASAVGFISSSDVTDLLSNRPGTHQYDAAKNIVCFANLSDLSCSLFSLHASGADTVPLALLSQLDSSSFPLDFAPATILGRHEWKQRTVKLAVDVRTQLAISMLKNADAKVAPQKVLLDVFCAGDVESSQDIDAALRNSSRFKPLPGWDTAELSNAELDADQIRDEYMARCRDMRKLLGTGETVTAEVMAHMAEKYPLGKFETDLQTWVDGITPDLLKTSPENHVFRTPRVSYLQADHGHDSSSHFGSPSASQQSIVSDVSISDIQEFVRAARGHEPSPQLDDLAAARTASIARASPPRNPSRKRRADEVDAESTQDYDSDEGFRFGRRGPVPASHLMPPPPLPRSPNQPSGNPRRGPRPKRARIDHEIPVDPSLTGGSSPPGSSQLPPGTLVNVNATESDASVVDAGGDDGSSRLSGTSAAPAAADLEYLSQRSKEVSQSARQRNPKPPQTRTPWTTHDCQQLIRAIDEHDAKWSKIAEQIRLGEIPFDHPRDQQALRDKARLLKMDILKTDMLLPPAFDNVVLGKKEREAVKMVGRNPYRKEADVLNGVPTATLLAYPDDAAEVEAVTSSAPLEEQHPPPSVAEEPSQDGTLGQRIVD